MARYSKTDASWRGAIICLALLLTTLACQPAETGTSATPTPRESSREKNNVSTPVRDLSQDEAAGGHTLRKHVGRTDDELRQRLRHERNIAAASTWTDRETAERAVGVAIEQNREKIDRWLARSGGHPNLVIDYDGDPSHPIGRTLNRDSDRTQPCSRATVVLRWSGPSDYYVLTSYPECRA
jgi:Bacterial CdiA-CT RNAse A domain